MKSQNLHSMASWMKKEALPYELIPPRANFRCCIYKEREIIRQRIRLAEGKSPSAGSDNKNVVRGD